MRLESKGLAYSSTSDLAINDKDNRPISELLGDLLGSATGDFVVRGYPLNVGLDIVFPWSAPGTTRHRRYSPRGPLILTFNNAGGSQVDGLLWIGYSSSHRDPPTTWQEMARMCGNTGLPIWKQARVAVPWVRGMAGLKTKLVRSSAVDKEEINDYDCGILWIGTSHTTTASSLGTLSIKGAMQLSEGIMPSAESAKTRQTFVTIDQTQTYNTSSTDTVASLPRIAQTQSSKNQLVEQLADKTVTFKDDAKNVRLKVLTQAAVSPNDTASGPEESNGMMTCIIKNGTLLHAASTSSQGGPDEGSLRNEYTGDFKKGDVLQLRHDTGPKTNSVVAAGNTVLDILSVGEKIAEKVASYGILAPVLSTKPGMAETVVLDSKSRAVAPSVISPPSSSVSAPSAVIAPSQPVSRKSASVKSLIETYRH